jgi:ribonuclease HI
MQKTAPHYLLLTETDYDPDNPGSGGRWRFVLESMHNDDRVEVSEREIDVWGERLQLLSVVRGVEALEEAAKITLITSSQYVGRQIRRGFERWIENDWRWERFGLLKPIKDADLWKRIHAATQIHSIECRVWQFGNQRLSSFESLESESEMIPSRNYGPIEFASSEDSVGSSNQFQSPHELAQVDSLDSRFRPTRTGWTRVTEVDPDSDRQLAFPQAFGGSVN